MEAVENVSLKIESDFLKMIERVMKRHRYMTKTEFIREAIRDKITELEKQEMLASAEKLFGSSKHKTTDEDLHRARERLEKIYEKRYSSK